MAFERRKGVYRRAKTNPYRRRDLSAFLRKLSQPKANSDSPFSNEQNGVNLDVIGDSSQQEINDTKNETKHNNNKHDVEIASKPQSTRSKPREIFWLSRTKSPRGTLSQGTLYPQDDKTYNFITENSKKQRGTGNNQEHVPSLHSWRNISNLAQRRMSVHEQLTKGMFRGSEVDQTPENKGNLTTELNKCTTNKETVQNDKTNFIFKKKKKHTDQRDHDIDDFIGSDKRNIPSHSKGESSGMNTNDINIIPSSKGKQILYSKQKKRKMNNHGHQHENRSMGTDSPAQIMYESPSKVLSQAKASRVDTKGLLKSDQCLKSKATSIDSADRETGSERKDNQNECLRKDEQNMEPVANHNDVRSLQNIDDSVNEFSDGNADCKESLISIGDVTKRKVNEGKGDTNKRSAQLISVSNTKKDSFLPTCDISIDVEDMVKTSEQLRNRKMETDGKPVNDAQTFSEIVMSLMHGGIQSTTFHRAKPERSNPQAFALDESSSDYEEWSICDNIENELDKEGFVYSSCALQRTNDLEDNDSDSDEDEDIPLSQTQDKERHVTEKHIQESQSMTFANSRCQTKLRKPEKSLVYNDSNRPYGGHKRRRAKDMNDANTEKNVMNLSCEESSSEDDSIVFVHPSMIQNRTDDYSDSSSLILSVDESCKGKINHPAEKDKLPIIVPATSATRSPKHFIFRKEKDLSNRINDKKERNHDCVQNQLRKSNEVGHNREVKRKSEQTLDLSNLRKKFEPQNHSSRHQDNDLRDNVNKSQNKNSATKSTLPKDHLKRRRMTSGDSEDEYVPEDTERKKLENLNELQETPRRSARVTRLSRRSGEIVPRTIDVIDLTEDVTSTDVTDSQNESEQRNPTLLQLLKNLEHMRLDIDVKSPLDLPRSPYLKPLTEEEQKLVKELTVGQKRNCKLSTIHSAKITLHHEDFKRLRGARWLNDELINAYCALINLRNRSIHIYLSEEERKDIPRTFVFNTFFYTRLTSGRDGYDYRGVERWTKRANVDILEYDLILIPVNLGNHHWVLVAIAIDKREFYYLDSMHGKDRAKVTDCLRKWLTDEITSKHGKDMLAKYDVPSWITKKNKYLIRRTNVIPDELEPGGGEPRITTIPRQGDGGSCGVFTAKTADCLSLGIKIYFKQPDIPVIRSRMAIDLFQRFIPM